NDYQNLKLLNSINPEETLFVISSKSFSTIETIENAKFIINYFKVPKNEFMKNFIAITSNEKKAEEFGIKNIIKFGEYINGRYSIWGAIGFPISCYIGFENFLEFLKGGREIDEHFKNEKFKRNVPVILGLLDVYYNNFLNFVGTAIICYDKRLEKFYKYIQQLWMESNGKSVDRNGNFINYNTAGIVFGGVGTDVQHSFFQLLHQGTRKILCDFICVANTNKEISHLHNIIISAFIGQTEALMNGKTEEEVIKELKGKMSEEEIKKILPYKIFTGNKPTNSILLKSITPRTIGKLIALYEHRIFVEGIVENIYSFDQFGVELGKEITEKILESIEKNKISENFSSSTLNLIKIYNEWSLK
ncbi:MAG: glucose-6-phosphate isomerase, partial [Candidatus Altarchaeaceae archaeon]